MHTSKISLLITIAKRRMEASKDPVHDLAHVTRVVERTQRFCSSMPLTEKECQALLLAAWWHDVGRTTTKRPSFIVMALLDDTLSALMLWRETMRIGLFGSVAGMSTRIIFCKSFGTGKILTRFLLRKKSRVLLHLLQDADAIDMIHTHRLHDIMAIAEQSIFSRGAYRLMVWWLAHSNQLRMKTAPAQQLFDEMIQEFFLWFHEQEIFSWHEYYFGETWTKNQVLRCERRFDVSL